MFLHNIISKFKSNDFFLFLYLFLILFFFTSLLIIGFTQLRKLIQKERQFSKLQTAIQSKTGNSFEEYLELGTLLLNKKLFGQAIKYFKLAIYNCDDLILLGNIYNNIGYCYFKQNKFDQAKYYYNEALLYLPDYIVALNNLAFLLENLKDYEKALNLYNQSYMLDSENIVTLKQRNRLKKLLSK